MKARAWHYSPASHLSGGHDFSKTLSEVEGSRADDRYNGEGPLPLRW